MSTKRQDIEKAAVRLFAERGFHGASVPEIARVAGVGPGTIYRHFESKEVLVNTLYQHWKVQVGSEVYANLPMSGSWRARFAALWQALFRFDREHPHVIDFIDLQYHSDYLDAQSREVEAQSATILFGLVGMAQAEEVFVDLPPPAVIALVYSSFLGLVRAEREGYLPLTPELIEATEERVWAMIRR